MYCCTCEIKLFFISFDYFIRFIENWIAERSFKFCNDEILWKLSCLTGISLCELFLMLVKMWSVASRQLTSSPEKILISFGTWGDELMWINSIFLLFKVSMNFKKKAVCRTAIQPFQKIKFFRIPPILSERSSDTRGIIHRFLLSCHSIPNRIVISFFLLP